MLQGRTGRMENFPSSRGSQDVFRPSSQNKHFQVLWFDVCLRVCGHPAGELCLPGYPGDVLVPTGSPVLWGFLCWQHSSTDEHICILICVQDFWSLLPQRIHIKCSFSSLPGRKKQNRAKNRDGFLLPFALLSLLSVITVYHLLLLCSNI